MRNPQKLNISIKNAKDNKLFYVVTTGVIYNPKTKKCLILQRSKREIAHPGIWGVVGGKLEHTDMLNNKPTMLNHGLPNWEGLVEKQLLREVEEESGLKVADPRLTDCLVFLRPDGVPVVLLRYALKYKSGKVKIPLDFEDFAWVNLKEVGKYKTIKGIDKEIKKAISIYSKS